ncbi:MAG: 6-phosphofructokinase [Anaerolineae bacterium]|nr:6-phosphofructokinase [Anaerolineae bacterium]
MRLGILTGGGDAPGLNAVIRAATRVAIRKLKWEVCGVEDGFEGLFDDNMVKPLTLPMVRGLLSRGGTILGTTNRGRLVTKGQLVQEQVAAAAERIKKLGFDGLIVIGGDGSLTIAQALYEHGAPIVGVPKTIDNDLSVTDYTFGFDTALQVAAEAVDNLHTTAESHDRVMLVEVMGRHVGWIALHAGIAGGADVILIPELPFSIEAVARAIAERDEAGAKFSIIVVAEGCRPRNGYEVYQAQGRLGGVAARVAEDLDAYHRQQGIDKDIRVVVLGHLQRGGSPTVFDRVLATRFGAAAAELVAQGQWGHMVALQGTKIITTDIATAIGALKRVSPTGQLVQQARDLGIYFGDES